MSRSELRPEVRPEDSPLDLTRLLEQHILAGFPLDLALDLVLNELVVRAAEATRASAAAIALARGDEMVCRAATGQLAPDLGVPLSTRDGLSGACLQTRQPQLSVDTEFDPRVDPAVSRRIGIRSILIVPVLEDKGGASEFAGVLEVFSTSPAAFSHHDQKRLEGFADDCVRLRRAAVRLGQRKPAAAETSTQSPEILPNDVVVPGSLAVPQPAYEAWTLVLAALAIVATIGVSFLMGSRVGWLRAVAFHSPPARITNADVGLKKEAAAPAKSGSPKAMRAISAKSVASVNPADELIVYEKGKVVFRMKPAPAKSDHATPDAREDSDAVVEASSTAKIPRSQSVWLAPAQAESRLLSRTEPMYPPEALASHRAGSVVLEVQVAEDGSVSSVRGLSGDPILTAAAAEAVHSWRYQPYRFHDRPSQFQTDVTLSFSLPN